MIAKIAAKASLFLVLGVFAGIDADSHSPVEEGNCTDVGVRCSPNGTQVEFCFQRGVDPFLIKKCERGEKCSNDFAAVLCRSVGKGNFYCINSGEYPDLYDKRKSFVCDGGSPIPVNECKCGWFSGDMLIREDKIQCGVDFFGPGRKEMSCSPGHHGPLLGEKNKPLDYCYYCTANNNYAIYKCKGGDSPFFEEPKKECKP